MRDLFRKESDALWLAKSIGFEGWLLLFFSLLFTLIFSPFCFFSLLSQVIIL